MDLSGLGKWLILAGVIIALAGVLITFAGKVPFLGKLPGDVTWKRGNFTFYFPLATSIVLSVVVTLILYVISRFGGKR